MGTTSTLSEKNASVRELIDVNYYVTSSEQSTNLQYSNVLPNDIDIFRNVIMKLDSISNESIRRQVVVFLSKFQNIIREYRYSLKNAGHFQALRIFNQNDGSVLVEWIFNDFRIGFSFEIEENESNWYLVSNNKLDEISSSGLIRNNNIDTVIINLLRFVTSNI